MAKNYCWSVAAIRLRQIRQAAFATGDRVCDGILYGRDGVGEVWRIQSSWPDYSKPVDEHCANLHVMRQIILASQSPRRRELLTIMGVDFEVVPSDFDEYLDNVRSPEEVAQELGLGKALTIAKQFPESIVIGSDTIVTIGGRQLAKAETLDEARQMLYDVTLHPNKITSSLAVVCLAEDLREVTSENSFVHFKPYDKLAVEEYLATGDYKDKAGAYGIQSGAAPLISYIEGSIDTIIGLPTHLLAPILQRLDYDVQPVQYQLPQAIICRPLTLDQ